MQTKQNGAAGASLASAIAVLRQAPLLLALSGVLALCYCASWGHDAQRILQLGFFAAAAAMMLLGLAFGRAPAAPAGAMPCLLIGFFVLGALSSAFAYSPRHAFYEVSTWFMLLLAALWVADEFGRGRAANAALALRLCGYGCLLYAFQLLVVYLSAVAEASQANASILVPNFSNYRFFNHTQTVTLPLLVLASLLCKPGDKSRWVWFTLAAYWWAMLFMIGGRGTFVGLGAGVVTVLLLLRGRARPFAGAMLRTALCGAALFAVLFVLVPRAAGLQPFGLLQEVAGRTGSDVTSNRLPLWQRALEMSAADPWLGGGPLHFAHHGADLRAGAHPHSWVMQIAAEWGLPALALLCLAVLLAARRLLLAGRRVAPGDTANQAMLAAWVCTGTAVLVDGLVSGLMVMPASQLCIVLYLACATGWSASMGAPVAPAPLAPLGRALLACAVLGATLGLAFGVGPEIGRVHAHQAIEETMELNKFQIRPRMWERGQF